MAKITSPIEGHAGTTYIGPLILEFKDGKADYDGELPAGVRAYLLGAGYKVGNTTGTPTASLDGAPIAEAVTVDARDYSHPTQVGTQLRDASVDPREGDFLVPTNAGHADPHGPDVVSPEIHASQGVRPVKGGDVHVGDTDAQNDAETKHAEDATDGTPVDDAAAVDLKGAALDEALEAAGLSKSGTADEKRARLAEQH